MKENELFDLRVPDADVKKLIDIFKKHKLDEESQNKIFEQYFVKFAESKGYNSHQIAMVKRMTHSVDFSLTKTDLIYKINSTSHLQKNINRAKEKINDNLRSNSEDVIFDSKTQKAEKPFRFEYKLQMLTSVCLKSSDQTPTLIYNELKNQALAQGFSQEELNKEFNYVEFGPKGNAKGKEFGTPKTLMDLIEEETQDVINDLSRITANPKEVRNIIRSKNNSPEMKLLVLCHLKEATDKEFNDLINMPEMKTFLGAETLKEVIEARKRDKELESVNGSNKVKAPRKPKQEKPEPALPPLSKEKEELGKLYGLSPQFLIEKSMAELEEYVNGLNLPTRRRDD